MFYKVYRDAIIRQNMVLSSANFSGEDEDREHEIGI